MFNIFTHKIKGYIYISDKSRYMKFNDVKEETIIKNKSKKPPYFVVNHRLNKLIIPEWPGKLFFVETLSPYKSLNLNLTKDAGYTRANGIKILKELQLHELFGENGRQIKQIVDKSNNVDISEAKLLSSSLTKESCKIYDKAWKRWNENNKIEFESSDDYLGTIGVISNEIKLKQHSPVGEALSIISNLVYNRVREIDEENGVVVDAEGETSFSELWSKTQQALLNATMAYENEDLLNVNEKHTLLESWSKLTSK